MGNINWFIPQKLNVGFCNREDTFTGKLAFITYFDEKGKMRKQTSFDNWRDWDIPTEIYDNTPMEGFVINKTVGGHKSYWWYGFRKSYFRVYDPRGFEFEIAADNLLYILKCSSCDNGELHGKFVYAMDGAELVLMPLNSPDYEELEKLNKSRFNKTKITKKNIVVGGTYLAKSGEKLVYLGEHDFYPFGNLCDGKFYEKTNNGYNKLEEYIESIRPAGTNPYDTSFYTIQCTQQLCGTRHYFSNLDKIDAITYKKDFSSLIEILSEDMVSDFDGRMAALRKQPEYSPVDKTKDEYVDFSCEEFKKEFPTMPGFYSRFALIEDDCITSIRIVNNFDGRYKLSRGEFYFEKRLELGRKFVPFNDFTEQPLTIEEIFDKFHFVRVNKYLQNGELYEQDFK